KALLLEAESGIINYGIKKMEEQRKTQTEQISIDTEFYSENPLKVLIELDSSNNKPDKNIEAEQP
ncbi:27588_t:CDS:1, partial [Gigaspora margarita]